MRIPITQDYSTVVDLDDYERLIDMGSWCYANGYAIRSKYSLTGKPGHLQMHRFINNTPDRMFTDHINGDGLDNRKCNLRTVSASENGMNRKRHRNRSYRGYYKTPTGRYVVGFMNRRIGSFDCEELAAQIYEMLLAGELPPERIYLPK